MANLTITTPRGAIITTTTASGKSVAKLEWNKDFARRRTNGFNIAQRFIDSEVLRMCDPRVPFDTGMLKLSGQLGTVIGSGEVKYIAPYAAKQYYHTATTRRYDPMRGGMWFERGKAAEGRRILAGAQRLAGGG